MRAYHFVAIAASIVLLFFSFNNLLFLWVANIMIGFGLSICSPGFFAYFVQFFDITDRIGATLIASSGLVSAAVPILVGQIIEQDPKILLYIISVGIISVIILFAKINVILFYTEKQFKKEDTINIQDENLEG